MKEKYTQEELDKIEEELMACYINLKNLKKNISHPLVNIPILQLEEVLKLLDIDVSLF